MDDKERAALTARIKHLSRMGEGMVLASKMDREARERESASGDAMTVEELVAKINAGEMPGFEGHTAWVLDERTFSTSIPTNGPMSVSVLVEVDKHCTP